MSSIGVVLANTGSPDEPTPQAVKRYLSRFLMDPRIVPMNRVCWWFILHAFILPKRSVASAEKYRIIWTPEGSPLLCAHEKLAQGLSAYYAARSLPVSVRCAMSYGEPSLANAIRSLAEEGCDQLVVLPLYPQSAFSTTGSVSDSVRRAVRKAHWKGEVTLIDNYHDDPVYVKAIAASIVHAGFDVASDDRLLFSFHSIPLGDIEDGDTYELQTGATCLAIANELGLDRRRWTVGYQCRFDKGRDWLAPFTSKTLESWADSATSSRVFMVCPNFAVDCLETLYDVEREIKPAYLERKRGIISKGAGAGAKDAADVAEDDFVYVPCLNKSKAHIKVLAHVLAPYVGDEVS